MEERRTKRIDALAGRDPTWRKLPPVTQAAMDAAGRAGEPSFEVLFSRGIPDAEAWRR